MTMTSRYDSGNPNHTVTCGRLKCSAPDVPIHQAGAHLDQRSPFYDGPDIQLAATSMYIRDSARKIIAEAPEMMPEVIDLVTYVDFLDDQTVALQVDRDRGIREASARALDCGTHGEVISGLESQVAAFESSARKSEAGRLALIGFLHAVDKGLDDMHGDTTLPELVVVLKAASKRAHAAHTRAWQS